MSESIRPPSNSSKQQLNNTNKPQPGTPGGLAAAMHTASKQEQMMPGHRPRERAASELIK